MISAIVVWTILQVYIYILFQLPQPNRQCSTGGVDMVSCWLALPALLCDYMDYDACYPMLYYTLMETEMRSQEFFLDFLLFPITARQINK